MKRIIQDNARRAAHEQVQAGSSFTGHLWSQLQSARDHFATDGTRNVLTNNSNAAPSFAETVSLLHRGRP